ncbi:NUDIX domain-containing protein [archaeon]|nr:MAG: NUDIX domain-containing protein [archaeon]
MGAGGVVVNERDEVLVVQEAHKNTGWKFPGGLADLAEDVADTAVREVGGQHPSARGQHAVRCHFLLSAHARSLHAARPRRALCRCLRKRACAPAFVRSLPSGTRTSWRGAGQTCSFYVACMR